MAGLKKLAGQTVLYGLSSILGRLINWVMVPLYTNVFQEPNYQQSEYGIQTQIMAYVAVVLVLITYGMETSFFRFSADEKQDRKLVFNTSQTSLLITSVLFVAIVFAFLQPLSQWLNVADRSYILILLAITLGIDAFCSIPFAKLRLDSRPLRFAIIKLINIGVNVSANLFFYLFCPYWLSKYPDSVLQNIYAHEVGVGYVFISYLLAAVITLLLLLPTLKAVKFQLQRPLLQKMLNYAFPILLVGLAGMLNLNFDKIAMKHLIVDAEAMTRLGEYGTAFKLGVLMTLFTQAYRYAFEPFFFGNKTAENAKELYADALKFFTIIGLVGFLCVVFYIDVIGLIIGKSYHAGFVVVPYVLLANLFLGMYYSLSLWYKLTDKTRYGAYMAFIGVAITVVLNVILVPKIGYMGSAYAFLFSSFVMFVVSLIWGQKHYPIPYSIPKITMYFIIAIGLYLLSQNVQITNYWLNLGFRTVLLMAYLFFIWKNESKLKGIRLKKINAKKMSKKELQFQYSEYASANELAQQDKKLIEAAKSATDNSYSPYSKFRVGVAILLDNGKIITGNNQENAAYPSGLCAERVAVFYANAQYPENAVVALAIVARNSEGFLEYPAAPCGSCRQVLLETEERFQQSMRILLYGTAQIVEIPNAKSLLPFFFDSSALD